MACHNTDLTSHKVMFHKVYEKYILLKMDL